jgi:hypothetical protein
MKRYWLDADVLIAAKGGPYPFDSEVGRAFWAMLSREIEDGFVVCPRKVFEEVTKGRERADQLAEFAKTREKKLCIKKTGKTVDGRAKDIGDYIFSNPQYPTRQALAFSRGGDSWLIAHAAIDGDTIVTNESSRYPDAQRVRIPDVCHKFNVRCIGLYAFIQEVEERRRLQNQSGRRAHHSS